MWIRVLVLAVLLKLLLSGCGGGGGRSSGDPDQVAGPIQGPDPQEPTFFPPDSSKAAFDVTILPGNGSLIDRRQTLHFHLNRPGRIFYAFNNGDLVRTDELTPVSVEEKSHKNSFEIEIPTSVSSNLTVRYFAVDENYNETTLRTARYSLSTYSSIKNGAVGSPLVVREMGGASGTTVAEARPLTGRTLLPQNIR